MPAVRKRAGGARRLEMRSRPQQSRSRFTVAVIKQAALQILAAEGIARCVTYRIAERAGISIGSLYQYFPNREAILKSLYEDASVEFAGAMQGVMLQILDLPTEQAVTVVMRKLVALHEGNHLILLRLVKEMPQLGLDTQPTSYNNLLLGSIRAYVQRRNNALTPRQLSHKVFFLERIILSSIEHYLNDPPPGMSRRDFTRNLAGIVASYIENSGH